MNITGVRDIKKLVKHNVCMNITGVGVLKVIVKHKV